MFQRHLILSAALFFALLSSCVPARKFEDMEKKRNDCEAELAKAKASNGTYESKIAELEKQIADNKVRLVGLQNDTNVYGTSIRLKTEQYSQLLSNYELLLKQNKELQSRQSQENSNLVGKLNLTQEELFRKEDELKRMELDIKRKQRTQDSLTVELNKRESRVKELEAALAAKDQAVNDLKQKVKNALVNFEGKGLTVTQKNGKVYVSMEDNLLFTSGSTKVQPKGEDALKKLAIVLQDNTDINVLVEGHTDNVPMKGAGDIKDNWDLSAMRATSVVKILLANGKIDPQRMTAAGRGEFFPIDPANTAEARAKNRRTEIILTPKLDELFKVLETN
jgi:chemotaxis protein MotB